MKIIAISKGWEWTCPVCSEINEIEELGRSGKMETCDNCYNNSTGNPVFYHIVES